MAELLHGRQNDPTNTRPCDKPTETSLMPLQLDGINEKRVDEPDQAIATSSSLSRRRSIVTGVKTVQSDASLNAASQVYTDRPVSPQLTPTPVVDGGQDEEAGRPPAFDRLSDPSPSTESHTGSSYAKVGKEGTCRMHKFSLYETAIRYYLIGGDVTDSRFRVLKIDRTAEETDLSIAEDEIVYTLKEMNQLLNTIDDGNKSTGGLKLKCSTWGLLGFIRFTGAYYMLLISKRSQVAMIGGHYIYQIDGTELIPLASPLSKSAKIYRRPEEARFVGILSNLDLSRSFYFSYSYDITRTLQHNIIRERNALQRGRLHPVQHDFNKMFVWNHYLLNAAKESLKNTYDWCLPIVHGFIDQASKNGLLDYMNPTDRMP